jgi:SAM-dependent methyltransferase
MTLRPQWTGMDRDDGRRAWESLSEPYATTRPTDGSDVDLLDDLLAALGPTPRVLDLGCGDGRRTLANLEGAERVGLDFARAGLDLASAAVPEAALVQGDMVRLPLATNTVDAVTAYHAVFHVPRERHPAVYDEVARVLRPGGAFLTTVGRGRSESVRRGWLGTGESMLFSTPGRGQTREQLDAAGFDVRWERSVEDPFGGSALFVLAELPE